MHWLLGTAILLASASVFAANAVLMASGLRDLACFAWDEKAISPQGSCGYGAAFYVSWVLATLLLVAGIGNMTLISPGDADKRFQASAGVLDPNRVCCADASTQFQASSVPMLLDSVVTASACALDPSPTSPTEASMQCDAQQP